VLATLVRAYIDTGEPVSSQVIARDSGTGVSSATVRNVLAQLEEYGYVHQPHTSAGRVPTDLGYRVFVDLLLEGRRTARSPFDVEQQIRQQAVRTPLMDDLLAGVSHLVSRAARHVGFTLAANAGAVLKRIEFVPLDWSQVLVVVVAHNNQVTQKVVDTGEAVRPDDLAQAARYLNTEFAGLPLAQVREAVLERLHQERTLYDQLLARALRLAHSTLTDLPKAQSFHVDGAASLLEQGAQDGVSTATLTALLEMMEEKERLIQLLNAYIDGPGLTIVIGTEHTSPDLQRFSLIASTAIDGSTMRTVGIIGPTRMHYSRTIALVDDATQAVSRVLRDPH
jgi:heat-inducible transcriptional repressor